MNMTPLRANLFLSSAVTAFIVLIACYGAFIAVRAEAAQQQRQQRAWSKMQRDYYDTGYRLGRGDYRDNRGRDHTRYRSREFNPNFEPYFREGYYDGFDGLPKRYAFSARDLEQLVPTGERWKVKCETTDARRECPAPVAGNVTILRTIGGTNCVEGQNWGWSSRGFWVDRGCRAEFGFEAGRALDAPPGPVERRILKCESTDGRRRECPAPVGGRIMIVRIIEFSRCEEGQSWGWSPRGIWVDRGCRAEFEYDVLTGLPPEEMAGNPRTKVAPSPSRASTPAEQWGDAERKAYDDGYARGRADYRNHLTREHRRYFNEFAPPLEAYFRKGYEDGFDGKPKDYKF